MTNPFAHMAAGSGGGWMTTKRKGKDDDQIRKDQERALQARKDARRKYAPTTKKPSSKKKTFTKKKRKPVDEDSDLDGFIVDDDDDDDDERDEYSGESESEEEAVVVPRTKKKTTKELSSSDDKDVSRKPRTSAAKNKPFKLSSSDDEQVDVPRKSNMVTKDEPLKLSSDDDDEGTFLGKFPKRTSRPPVAMLSKAKRTALRDASNRFVEEKKQDLSSFSSDESQAQVSRFFATGNTKKKKKEAPLFQKREASSDDESELDVTPFKPGKQKAKAPGTAKTTFLDDSSDEDIPMKPKRSRATDFDDDDAMDSDEAAAVAFALEQSQKPTVKRKRLKNSRPDKKKRKKKKNRRVVVALSDGEDGVLEDEVEAILEESSGGEEEEQDAYEGEVAKEAGSVLQAANTLSAKVLQTMVGWQQDDGAAGSVPTGIIVDGALSLVQCGNTASHSWIPQELMQTICPEVKLADYQLVGVNWLALLHGLTCDVDGKKGANVNGVLADEMGLGKTVQTITFLAWLRYHNREAKGNPPVIALDDDSADDANVVSLVDSPAPSSDRPRPHIIIVPASVLSNWEREFEKFCPDMNIIKYHGSMAEREDIKDTMRKYLPNRNGGPAAHPPLDVVLTTFSYFSSEKTDDRNFLRKFKFDYMVVDEAHCLKNPRGLRYRNLDKFETSHRLLLTGTPVQNSPQELMSLLCFLMPLFSKSEGGNGFDCDEETKNDGGASMLKHFVSLEASNVNTEDDANEAAYRNLKQLFAPFVLRRKKIDVLSQIMPPKTRKVEFVPFDDATRKVYDSILAAHIDKRENGSMAISASVHQHLFTALRKAANHPLLLRTRHTSPEAISHLAKNLFQFGYFGRHETCTERHVRQELDSFSDFDLHCAALELLEENPLRHDELSRYTLAEEDLFSSPKFVRLRALLPELIEKGHRVLIFSQWTRCLDLLGCLLDSLKMECLRLDGGTAISERQKLIDKFNQDSSIPVFLLSTRAGGMGINLTAADVCILHDLDFNPFNDVQAEDRCHRIGQTKPVTVYKMVTEGTVDADIYEMQQRKARMNAAILESSKEVADNNKDDADISNILQSAVNRFLHSPEPKAAKADEQTLI